MRLLADDVFVAALAVGHQSEQVAHGPGRYEERRGEAQARRQFGLQAVDRGVLAIDVVAQFGRGHGFAHAGGGLGDGVAAQVDDRHGGLLGSAEKPDPTALYRQPQGKSGNLPGRNGNGAPKRSVMIERKADTPQSLAGTTRIPARRPFFTRGLGKMMRAPTSSTTQRVPPISSASR